MQIGIFGVSNEFQFQRNVWRQGPWLLFLTTRLYRYRVLVAIDKEVHHEFCCRRWFRATSVLPCLCLYIFIWFWFFPISCHMYTVSCPLEFVAFYKKGVLKYEVILMNEWVVNLGWTYYHVWIYVVFTSKKRISSSNNTNARKTQTLGNSISKLKTRQTFCLKRHSSKQILKKSF